MYKILLMSLLLVSCGQNGIGKGGSNGANGSPGKDGSGCTVSTISGGSVVTCGGSTVFVPNGVDGVGQATIKDLMQRACVTEVSSFLSSKSSLLSHVVGKTLDDDFKAELETGIGELYTVTEQDSRANEGSNVDAVGLYRIDINIEYNSIPLACGSIQLTTNDADPAMTSDGDADGSITEYVTTLNLN